MPSITVPTVVAAGVGAAGSIGGAIISGNAADNAANTSAAAARDGQAMQAQQYGQTRSDLQTSAANANAVQGQQHDASVAALTDASGRAIDVQNNAVSNVAGVQSGLYGNTTDTINRGYNDARAANQPYLDIGTSALERLGQIYNVNGAGTSGGNLDPNATFWQSPDYQFRMSQGIKGTDAGAAARGMLDSGATRKAEIQYAGNLASGEFNSYAQRLAGLAGIGQTAVGQNAAGTTNYVNAITNANTGYGNQYQNLVTGSANNISNNLTGTANQIAGANTNYASQYGNAQVGVGSDLATNASSYGNNYANSVMNAANAQNNANFAGANAVTGGINSAAGKIAQYATSNPANGSSYTIPQGGSGFGMGYAGSGFYSDGNFIG